MQCVAKCGILLSSVVQRGAVWQVLILGWDKTYVCMCEVGCPLSKSSPRLTRVVTGPSRNILKQDTRTSHIPHSPRICHMTHSLHTLHIVHTHATERILHAHATEHILHTHTSHLTHIPHSAHTCHIQLWTNNFGPL